MENKRRYMGVPALRRKRINKSKVAVFIGLTLFAILFLNMFSIKAKGNDEHQAPVYKYYTRIQIEKGDSLWSIAGEYMDSDYYDSRIEYIKDIKLINSMSSNKIISGNYIIVPYYSAEYR